jgi:predicted ArsR family transcriptional regulator
VPDRQQRFHNAIVHSADGFIVGAEMAAEKLGLSPDAFWRELKRGIVYGVVERGEGDDAGRTRLTFRYRARSWSVTLEEWTNDEPNR